MDDKQIMAKRLMCAFFPVRRMYGEHFYTEQMNFSEMSILFYLKRQADPLRACEFARRLRVTPPTVTQMLTKLEKDGMVTRVNDQKDRRVVLVNLTQKGRDVVNRVEHHTVENFMGLYEALGQEDAGKLTELLERTRIYFEEHFESKGGKIC